jgi:hypothetical protein
MSATTPETERPPLWALLVGVNEYAINLDATRADEHISPLRGCVPDVEAVDTYLRAQLAVPNAQIRLLRDSEATYAAVLAGFTDFLMHAPAGHQTLVYFSCHGSQAPAVDPSIEADGLDETLVLYDSRTEGVFDLLDKELGYLLDQLVQRGLNITVVLDACHSGSGTRDTDTEVRARSTPKDSRTRDVGQVYGGRAAHELARSRQGGSDWVNPASGAASYVVIAGCRDEQLSREVSTAAGPHGLLSYYLMDELQRSVRATTTYADLAHVLRARVRARIPDQEPQCEGDVNRLIFAAGRVRRRPPITIKHVSGETAVIEIGAAQGLRAGSRLLAFPAGADMSDASGAIARLEVTRVGATESDTQLIEWLPGAPAGPPELPITALLTVESYAYHPKQKVYLDGDGLDVVRTTIGTSGPDGQPSPYLELTEQRAEARLVVSRQGDALRVSSAQGAPLIPDTRPPAGSPPDLERLADDVVLKLEHLSRYWYAYALAPVPDEDVLAGLVQVEICRVIAPGAPPQVEPIPSNELVARTGELLALRLTNLHTADLYVSIWDFTPEWSVEPLYPANGGTERLVPNNPVLYQLPATVSLPPGLDEGVDLLKVFVTTESTQSFKNLAQDALGIWQRSITKNAEESPLGHFLADLSRGKRSLGGRAIAQWSVVDMPVTVLGDPRKTPLRPGQPARLTSGVVVRTSANLSGTLRVATRDQSTRGAGADPGLRPPAAIAAAPEVFEPLPLARTRAGSSPALVLSIEAEATSLQAVSADTPLLVDVPADLADTNDRLLAIAYDGRDYFLVGGPRPNDGGAGLAVEWLPVPQDVASPARTTDRGLAHTVRLMFYKFTADSIPAIGLRRAEVRDGRVSYAAIEPGSIAEGARVLLCIHGITADSRSIVQTIGARLQGDMHYDHLLAFDYESFTTEVRDNAGTLRAALHDAGVRAGRDVQLDIVAHSMGGLVARALIELDPEGGLVRRLVMAGTPNAGSPLANTARFGLAIGSFALGAAVPGALSKVVAWGLNWMREQALGLQNLQTGSALVAALKNGRRPDSVRYLALAGTYIPTDPQAQQAAGIFNRMLDGAFDRFFNDTANDLVVASSSVLSVQPACDFTIKPACDHSGYFSDVMLKDHYQQLHDWLAG